ncbi:MAG TPA: protein kinase [Pyrinomonadaceae bacterium]|nr:protein kinase [Pyrinomonadaceae bacterium]
MIGQTVSHYRIIESLGEGGMGTVYLAEDTHLGRRVAIKFPSLGSDTHDYRARFLREARAVSELSHPGIATLFDYGETAEGRPFLVMELAKGRPLTDLMQKGELSLLRAVEIVTDIAAALALAHARGVVHRDIKPSNIMIDDEGMVKVLDFGLAKQLTRENLPASAPEAQTLLSTQTRSGVVLGTPAYLSPEQATGGAVDGRSDLFALGTLLYEATTGHTPFKGNSFIEIAANVLHVEPTPPKKINHQVSRELEFIILKALNKKPIKRYQSAKELIADLKEVKKGLEDASGNTLIRHTSPSMITTTNKTLSNLSQILQRPRIPISYILVGAVLLIIAGGLILRFARPSPHKPTPEAARWFEIGTAALRDGAYYQASQALGQAITADDGFMLAHARLAEALVELDYLDQAKNELLRLNAGDRAKLTNLDALYLDAITATAREDFAKAIDLYKQIANQVPEAEKAYMLVDLGRAYEKNNDLQAAIQSYSEAATKNPQYATAYLHLGIAYGKLGDLDKAMNSFEKAESIYQARGNLEGRVEVVFNRGALLNKSNKLAEAKPELEKALLLAQANDNKSQIIKTLLQLSSVAFDGGETVRSTEYAQQGVDLAEKQGMENLLPQALVNLGQSFLVRGMQTEAEKYLAQALAAAERSKARRNEARARVTIANLRLQQNKPDEVIRYVEPALAFYRQGGYRTETFQCLALIARANLHKGDHAAAQASHEQLLQLARETNDQSLLALAHAERGSALAREEKFAEALVHLNQAYSIYSSQGIQRSTGYNLVNRANVLVSLGRFDEARGLVAQATAIAEKPGSQLRRLSVESKLVLAELALLQGDYRDARSRAETVLVEAGKDFEGPATGARIVIALAQSFSGSTAAGQKVAAQVVEAAKLLNDPAELGTAQLVLAEATLLAGNSPAASTHALEAAGVFARLGQVASEWRALAIAAQASRNSGDKTRAREYAVRAKDLLSRLEQRWGSENYQSYMRRPDVQRNWKHVEQIAASL